MSGSNEQAAGEARRLHPISMLYFVSKGVKELYGWLPLIPVLAITAPKVFGPGASRLVVASVLAGGAVLLLVGIAWLRWRKFMYRIDADGIYAEHGLWVQKRLWITKESVQSLDTKAAVYDRMFGLVSLRLENAGASESEAMFSSVTRAEAERIRIALGFAPSAGASDGREQKHHEAEPTPTPAAPGYSALPASHSGKAAGSETTVIARTLSRQELLLHSTTTDKFGVILLLAAGGMGKLWDSWLADSAAWDFFAHRLGALGIGLAAMLLLFLCWLVAVAATYLTDYGFEVRLHDEKLHIAKGLLERKQFTLRRDRIQAVHLIDHALRRPFGLVTIRLIIAGAQENNEKTTVLFPLMKEAHAADFLARFLPAYVYQREWSVLDRSARRHYVFIPAFICGLLAMPAMIWIPGGFGWLALLLPAFAWLAGELSYRQTGWAMHGDQLAIRKGLFARHRILMPRRRVQWYRMTETPFQRTRGTASLKVTLASGQAGKPADIAHLPKPQAEAILRFLSRR
ncbi:PH domain-containing protein [Paenibacillus xanthanilyticus]|uniref:PH domain-containing protein n=1 Tax=Paenibacillus xanthanilyticus TaxID=1783531 RepID=A0ABV8JZN0_9BACL